jgi:alkanesulfonate monooxygenase SsuD/methylene tetrahydromethanopterin reductase-like flavin-dependent oxidoreductase (luciferase family)
VDIGIFDHLDRGGKSDPQFYAERGRIAQAFEQAGFYSYHVAEHHFTTLGMAPSPTVFLAGVAAQTKTLRVGALVFALPMYDPLRLLQEICMLDNMSGGRLDMGFGRGSSSIEAAYYGEETSQDTYAEALEVILAGLQTDRLTFHGKRFDYDNVPIMLSPFQKPYPPIWYGVHSIEASERAARRGYNMVSADSVADTRGFHDHYRKVWREAHPGRKLPRLGLTRFVVVAETDDKAREIASRAYRYWHESFHWLFRLHGRIPRLGERARTFDLVIEEGRGIAGSPETVARVLSRQLEESASNYFVGQFVFGDMSVDETLRSIDLFKTRVMPRLDEVDAKLPAL